MFSKLGLAALHNCAVSHVHWTIWCINVVFLFENYWLSLYSIKELNHLSFNLSFLKMHLWILKCDWKQNLNILRPNLKNLSRGLNLSRGSNLMAWFHLKFYSIFQDLSRRLIETGFGGDLRPGLNSLNLNTDLRNLHLLTI